MREAVLVNVPQGLLAVISLKNHASDLLTLKLFTKNGMDMHLRATVIALLYSHHSFFALL